eukprot:g3299.t1
MSPDGIPLRSRNPVRVEPKTYFANERTFIQWLSAAMLIMSIGMALIEMEGKRDGGGGVSAAGVACAVVSLIIMLYALWTFLWRVKKITRKDPGGYDDTRGPVFLVLMLVAGLCTFLVVHHHNLPGNTNTSAALAPSPAVAASKEYQLELDPERFTVHAAGLLLVRDTIDAHALASTVPTASTASADSPAWAPIKTLEHQTNLDTPDDALRSANTVLKFERYYGKSGPPSLKSASLMLKVRSADIDVLPVFTCSEAYREKHCKVKQEQDLYVGRSMHARSAKVEGLGEDAPLTTLRHTLQTYFDGAPVHPASEFAHLYARRQYLTLQYRFPFLLADRALEGTVTLQYNSTNATAVWLSGSGASAPAPAPAVAPMVALGAELSFRVAAKATGAYDTQLSAAAGELHAHLGAADWTL